ncbi:hypothetical protein [Streptomyces silvisoli]|uniref:Uncharacterized protein n=1 Tax=Streptomyces silvisoli TaxID=3034235 RepID=A0ABT5ZWD8_9ACTN|nr:hypothetical protein [Streptomyces silvisoli]MDF3294132.1 hypothetical protein [Streptomyces silvisoli]
MAALTKPESSHPDDEDTLRNAWRDCRNWWSQRATTGQKIATVAAVATCVATTGAILAHSLGLFSAVDTTVTWTHGTYTVPQECAKGGILPIKINNAAPTGSTVRVDDPYYFAPLPLYRSGTSDASIPAVAIPAHGSVTVYLKLGEASLECANDAADVLRVESDSPPNPPEPPIN